MILEEERYLKITEHDADISVAFAAFDLGMKNSYYFESANIYRTLLMLN